MVIKRDKITNNDRKIQIKETKYCATETKLKPGGGLGSAGKMRSYYITSDIRSVIFAKYPVIIHQ